jgi:hypothetical protein
MPYQTKDLYSTRHAAAIDAFKSVDFPTTGDWKGVIDDARLMVVADGFNVEKYKASEAIRTKISAGIKKDVRPAATMLTAAGVTSLPSTGAKLIPAGVIKRVAALELVRHLWLLKKSGGHRVWVLSLPNDYRDWPESDLDGKSYDGIAARLNDPSAHFGMDYRKHLSAATQQGLKWVHKAMLVAASPAKKKNKEILQRWFADANTTDGEIAAAAAVLNDGLKKIAVRINSTFLLFVDMPMNRGDASKASTTAFVFSGEKIDVIYVEAAFFSPHDLFKDLKNWTRIVVHELSHREAKTEDHRYRHHAAGLKPDAGDPRFTAAKALNNADSWAMFCMDCAGQMSSGDYAKVKV